MVEVNPRLAGGNDIRAIQTLGELTSFELELSIDDGESYQLQGQVDGKLQLTRGEVGDEG